MSIAETTVLVSGYGVAANTATHLLSETNPNVCFESRSIPSDDHMIVIQEETYRLISESFPNAYRIFNNQWRLEKHALIGSPSCIHHPKVKEQRGIVMPRSVLNNWMLSHIHRNNFNYNKISSSETVWKLIAEKQRGEDSKISAGCRNLLATEVRFRSQWKSNCSLLIIGEYSWGFIAPYCDNQATLQIMVADEIEENSIELEDLFADLKLEHLGFELVSKKKQIFSLGPYIVQQPAKINTIAMGSSAISIDPICGDGTGLSLRTGILATSVINSIANGVDGNKCIEHYNQRLRLTFKNHLISCIEFYNNGFSNSTVWKDEINSMLYAVEELSNNYDFELVLDAKNRSLLHR